MSVFFFLLFFSSFFQDLIAGNEHLWQRHVREEFPQRVEEKPVFDSWRDLFLVKTPLFLFLAFFFLSIFCCLSFSQTCQQDKEEVLRLAKQRYREKILLEDQAKKTRAIQIVDTADVVDRHVQRRFSSDGRKEKERGSHHSAEWLKFLKTTGV